MQASFAAGARGEEEGSRVSLHAPTEVLPLWSQVRQQQKAEHRLPDPPEITPATDALAARFKRFHEQNPQVYRALADKAEQLLREGRTRIGIALLMEELRHDYRLGTRGDQFKLNNDYRAFYARMLRDRIPALKDVMEVRVQTHALKKKEGAGA
jgi:hypothetical protein